MVERSIPCKECRDRRRKCIRTSIYDTCSRCERLERECVLSDEEPNYTGYDKDFPRLQKQVEELNSLLKEMEKQARSLSSYNNNNSNNMQLMMTDNNAYINRKPWKITFHNGKLSIETGICSISDLLMQCLPIQYLSPLQPPSKDEKDLVIQFDSGKTIRFIPLTVKLLEKCIASIPNPAPLLLPPALDINAEIEQLINIYFHCRNTYKPHIHKKTFMQYYRKLRSPLDSLICLCLCCTVCAIPCNHISDDPYKYRQLGDFIYGLAKSKLMNQFDETDKQLENLVAINLLNEYMIGTLNLEDFKNFVTIGYRICLNLEPWFESTKDQGNTVERSLYSRHFLSIFLSQAFLSLITNEPMHYLSIVYPNWLLIDDEPEKTASLVAIQNFLIKLYNHPYLNNIKIQIHYQLKGDPISIKFESIVRLDDVLREWWMDIPSEYRVCKDWLDMAETKAAIDKCENEDCFTLFNYFISLMIDIYSSFLQPKALGTSNNQILSVVQDLSLKRSMHCCQLLIYSQVKSINLSDTLSCQSILAVNENLFHTLDTLVVLVFSSNNTIRTAAKDMLTQSLSMIDNVRFMHFHKVDSFHSPIRASVQANDINSINLSEYFKYPQPWLAMLYDLAHNLENIQATYGPPSLVHLSN